LAECSKSVDNGTELSSSVRQRVSIQRSGHFRWRRGNRRGLLVLRQKPRAETSSTQGRLGTALNLPKHVRNQGREQVWPLFRPKTAQLKGYSFLR